jgi:serine-type D-Ala-D-Ala carboxypeptidase/endopeptidase (penicillin-binding protein 4)
MMMNPRLRVLLILNGLALTVLVAMLVRGGGQDSTVLAGDDESDVDVVLSSPRPAIEAPAVDELPTVPPNPRGDPRLQRRIETAIANALAEAGRRSKGKVTTANTVVAVHVIELGSGAQLAAVQADRSLRPASALKLFTCATALSLLGPDWAFETPFEATGPIAGGVLEGDLVARAAGDPLFREDAQGDLTPWLDALAKDLKAAGVTRVRGALVLDPGTFLDPGPGPAWPDPSQYWTRSCALSGGFSANAGCLTTTITPGPAGGPATVSLRPRDHGLRRRGTVTTGGKALKIDVGANAGGVTVKGNLPPGSKPYVARFAHPDPVALFGSAITAGLARRGVAIEAGFRVERGAPAGREVARLRSGLGDVLVPILTHSRNSVADQLFFATAHASGERGDRAGGRAATGRALAALGISDQGLVLVDGSGLSRDNRVCPRQFTALLSAVLTRKDERARRLFEALPVAGETGTLEGRMGDSVARGRVHAKTGFIGGTSALAGVARTLDGRELAFAILVSYPRVSGLNTHCWKPMGDAICAALVESKSEGQ